MSLAEQAGLSELVTAKVTLTAVTVASAGTNPAGKLPSIIAGMSRRHSRTHPGRETATTAY
jgi:hypothetical protein